MTSVEATSETFTQMSPNPGKKFIYLACTTTNAADFVTFATTGSTSLKVIEGARLHSSTGATIAGLTWSANVLTFTNGATGSKVWSGMVWGY